MVEKLLRSAVEKKHRFIQFPIISAGVGSELKKGDHWTLLVLDLKDVKWRFYNPRRPRLNDRYLQDALLLVDKIKDVINSRLMDITQLSVTAAMMENIAIMDKGTQQDDASYAWYEEVSPKLSTEEMLEVKANVLEHLLSSKYTRGTVADGSKKVETTKAVMNAAEPIEVPIDNVRDESKKVETAEDVLRALKSMEGSIFS